MLGKAVNAGARQRRNPLFPLVQSGRPASEPTFHAETISHVETEKGDVRSDRSRAITKHEGSMSGRGRSATSATDSGPHVRLRFGSLSGNERSLINARLGGSRCSRRRPRTGPICIPPRRVRRYCSIDSLPCRKRSSPRRTGCERAA